MTAPEVSLAVALYDYLPNIVFIFGIYFIIQSIRNEIKKIYCITMIVGAILVLIAGILKATWKLVIALVDKDVRILSDVQFPLMGTGFFIIFIILVMALLKKGGGKASSLNAVGMVPSQKLFLTMMILGGAGMTICLIILSWKRKATAAVIFFILDFVMTSSLGYVGSNFDFTTNYGVFLEQTFNVSSRIIWAIGCYFLWEKSKSIQKATS